MPGVYEFFTGIIEGAVGRPPMLFNGVKRTALNLGFGTNVDAQNHITFHNHLTEQAVRYGFNFIIGTHPNPTMIQQVWSHLPEQAQNQITDYAWNTAGQFTGGAAVSALASKTLTHGLKLPKQIVLPAMFIIGIQGSMAALWRDVPK